MACTNIASELHGVAEWAGYMMRANISVPMCGALVQVSPITEKVGHNVRPKNRRNGVTGKFGRLERLSDSAT